jgi:hypothetical protein
MEWATTARDDETRWEIACRLSAIWQTRGLLGEARRWLETDLDEASISPQLRLEVLNEASTMAIRQGDMDSVRAIAPQLLALARELHRPSSEVSALTKLAQVELKSGNVERARRLNDEAAALAEESPDERALLVSLSSQLNADLIAGRVSNWQSRHPAAHST